MMKRIAYITGGSSRYGFGHIRRSFALAIQLRRSFKVSFYVYSGGALIKGFGLRKTVYIERPFIDVPCDLILLDLPERLAEKAVQYYRHAKGAIPIIALGYYATSADRPDAIINLDRISGYDRSLGAKLYSGLEYAIIREKFFRYRRAKLSFNPHAVTVVISLGGADDKYLSEKIIASLEKKADSYKNIRFHLIMGPLVNKKRTKILNRLRGLKLNVHSIPADMEKRMADADIAICNGGTTLLEYAFLGVPAIAIPQTELEKKFILR